MILNEIIHWSFPMVFLNLRFISPYYPAKEGFSNPLGQFDTELSVVISV